MAVPKQKQTQSRKNRRRSHHFLASKNFSNCSKCGSPVMPHRVCLNCGTYKGREVIDVFAKLGKKEKKKKQKELEEQEQSSQGEMSMEQMSKN